MLENLKTALLRKRQTAEQEQAAEYAALVTSALAGELSDNDADRADATLRRCGVSFAQFEDDCGRRRTVLALEAQAGRAAELSATVRALKERRAKLDADFARAKAKYETACRECDAERHRVQTELTAAGEARERLRREFSADSEVGAAAAAARRRERGGDSADAGPQGAAVGETAAATA